MADAPNVSGPSTTVGGVKTSHDSPPPPESPVSAQEKVTAAERKAVVSLAERCSAADGTAPLNDAARLHLGDHSDAVVRHWLLRCDDELIGYAQLSPDNTVQLCVDPRHRQRGRASAMIEQILTAAETEDRELSWWAFGALAPAKGLAAKLDLSPGRELLIMERPLNETIPAVELPADVTVSTFTPEDAAAWLRVNAAAFAQHPEQGAVTAEDFSALRREPWFNPAGFFLAYRGDQLLGYHWTKIHHDAPQESPSPAVGEVYVLGVDPGAGRSGIGRALLNRGLAYLAESGLDSVILYVEADQAHVVNLYTSSGFVVAHRDVLYRAGSLEQGAS